jgi:peptide deformylase
MDLITGGRMSAKIRNQRRRPRGRSVVPSSAPAAPVLPDPSELKVVVWPADVLSQPARAIKSIDAWLLAVAEKMKQLMEESKGVGLAAPQVGLSLRMFVMSESGKASEASVWINPTLSTPLGEETSEEGCLSIPDIRGDVTRAKEVSIRGTDITGQIIEKRLVDFPARIAQHEFDHLEGILILDRFTSVQKIALRKKIRALEQAGS